MQADGPCDAAGRATNIFIMRNPDKLARPRGIAIS
jgi:hypothetical protein